MTATPDGWFGTLRALSNASTRLLSTSFQSRSFSLILFHVCSRSMPKKIVVFPASGWQGRSVCASLSSDPAYEVIAVVRNLDSPKLSGELTSRLGLSR